MYIRKKINPACSLSLILAVICIRLAPQIFENGKRKKKDDLQVLLMNFRQKGDSGDLFIRRL